MLQGLSSSKRNYPYLCVYSEAVTEAVLSLLASFFPSIRHFQHKWGEYLGIGASLSALYSTAVISVAALAALSKWCRDGIPQEAHNTVISL